MKPDRERVALITGASRGLGRAVTLALAQRGWRVVINYRENVAAAQETLAAVVQAGGEGIMVCADVQDRAAREKLLHETWQRFERIDLLVNNAGMAPRARVDVLEVSEAGYDEVMAVNLKGPFFLTQQVARRMIAAVAAGKTSAPKIINLGSVSAYASSTNRAAYCISKAGLAMMTKLFAHRLAEHGIQVYEIRPGLIATDMTSAVKEKYDGMIAAGLTPIARWGQAEEVARAVVAIAEGALPFSTGEVINVDGGFHLQRL
jgi:NAD(P)-dependent dehydrogenase (short-subunit alcohol dehydrogenase family)